MRVGGRLNVLRAELLDDQVGREVAADRDHRFGEIAVRHASAEAPVDRGVGILAGVEREGAAVDDAVELVDDRDLVVEREPSSLGLTEQLDQHRHLHRAGGVELDVRLDQQLVVGRSSVRNATATSAPLFLISASISRRSPGANDALSGKA